MPAADFYIGQNDHGESLSDTLEDSTGAPVDISGATITLTVAPLAGGSPILNAVAASNDQNGNGSDGSKGKVHYVWQAADTAAAGLYLGRWTVTYAGGQVQSFPNGGYILIEITAPATSSATTSYVTVEQLKASLTLTGQTFADADIQTAISAAARTIDAQTGRRFYPDADAQQTRMFWPLNPGFCLIDDLSTFTSLNYQGDTWTLGSDFYLEPMNAAADGRPYTGIRTIARPFIYTLAERAPGWAGFDGRITVVGKWGWATTPPEIVEATSILASRLLRRAREAPFAVVGAGIEGEAIRLAKMDPDVAMLIAPYELSVIA